ncbi:hypothetical protein F383_28107 [Gossypium arboreum]|uniref:Uncharacterized protein n=1 Tax=Gossypium arboreum TaxID=29729 RepID=A0A0B0PAE6_GOSAR|nr:hypothetical protein F383_28107 [Gossypium arboreum]
MMQRSKFKHPSSLRL